MIDSKAMGNWRETDMDGGPYRAPQPADRRVVSRSEQTRRHVEELQAAKVEPKVVHRSVPPQPVTYDKKSRKRFLLPLIALVVAILGLAGWSAWANAQSTETGIDTGKYQAVFFTNGQVYFGKLKPLSDEYLQLTDIFYLQTQTSGEADSEDLQESTADSGSVQLIKLGDEVHGPEDRMTISKDQVLFYENLKTDSKVVESIKAYKDAQ